MVLWFIIISVKVINNVPLDLLTLQNYNPSSSSHHVKKHNP